VAACYSLKGDCADCLIEKAAISLNQYKRWIGRSRDMVFNGNMGLS